jgi:hypothetical protein
MPRLEQNVTFPVLIFWQRDDGGMKTEWIPNVSINGGIEEQVLRILPFTLTQFNIPIDPATLFDAFWLDSDSWIADTAEQASPEWAERPLVAVDRRIAEHGIDYFKALVLAVPQYQDAWSAATARKSRSHRTQGAPLPEHREFDLFISHASEDKDSIARPLYKELVARGCKVWFDETVLQLGDSLRRKIDEGLTRCLYGVVILSPNFFQKEWPRKELDGLVARETASGGKAILPIWHKIDHSGVAAYSPTLADRIAAPSSEGVPAVAAQILAVLGK